MNVPVMQSFHVSELVAANAASGRRYTEFLRVPAMSAGIYTLPAVAGFWTLFAAFPMDHSLPHDAAGDTRGPLNQTQALAAMAHAGDTTAHFSIVWSLRRG